MPIVINATEETQTFKAFGSWFTFKPGQQKLMGDDIAGFISEHRKEHGLVVLPKDFEEDTSFASTEEGKKLLAKAKETGLGHYLAHLRDIIKNNQVSLRRDLEMANIKADPAAYASDGEIEAMVLLAKYNKQEKRNAKDKADKVKQLVKEIGPLK